jgi:hypothetical protein
MSAALLAEKLGSRVTGLTSLEMALPFTAVEWVLPPAQPWPDAAAARTLAPGRAYVIAGPAPLNPQPGCVLLTVEHLAEIAGCAVIRCAGSLDDLYRAAVQILDDFQHFANDLTDQMAVGADIGRLVDIAADYLQNQLLIVDRSMQMLAVSHLEALLPDDNWTYIQEHHRLPDRVVERLAPLYRQSKSSAAEPLQRLAKGTELYGIPNIHVDLVFRGVFLGWLVLVANRTPMSHGQIDILEQLALPFTHLMKIHHEDSKPDLPFTDYYWQELLAGRLENTALVEAMLRERNWREQDFYRVIHLPAADGNLVPSVLSAIRVALPAVIALAERSAVTIVERLDPSQAEPAKTTGALQPILSSYNLKAGASDVAAGVATLNVLNEQALIASSWAPAPAGATTEYRCLAVEHLLRSAEPAGTAKTFTHPAIRRLLAKGDAKSRKQLETLLCYLENERLLQPTARQLFIHKNTLLYRINLLEQAYDLHLDDPVERLRLLLSIKLSLQP